MYFEELSLIIASVYGILIVAGIGEKLSPVYFERGQAERAVGVFHVFAVLPLYDSFRTIRIHS